MLANLVGVPGTASGRSGCFFEEPNYCQENYRPNDGVDDFRANAADEDKPELRQKPAGNEGADNADHDVADESKTVALHDLACEPAGNRTDNQPND
jgi:hypothetical protein